MRTQRIVPADNKCPVSYVDMTADGANDKKKPKLKCEIKIILFSFRLYFDSA